MKIRFDVNQAEAFRQGIDCPKSIVTIDLDPAQVDPQKRSLLADRLQGIDVLELFWYDGEIIKGQPFKELRDAHVEPRRIVAWAPTFDALMAAVEANARSIELIQARFRHPVQLRLLKEPPANANEFCPVQWIREEFAEDVRPWIEKGERLVLECFLEDVQTKLCELLNAKSYTVSILPIPGKTAQARFYCERAFSAKFSGQQVVAHSPTIVYNEETNRVVDAANLFQALQIYMLQVTTPRKSLSEPTFILRWEGERWVIIAPEGLIDLENKARKATSN
jgi:hypothetical protein